MFSHILFFLLGSQSTSHFPSKVWAKYAVLYMLCQTGSELKPKKSCVLEPAVVNCQILTGETDVTKRKPKFKLWQFQKLHAFRQNLKMPKYWFMQHSSQCPWFLKNVQSFSQSWQTLLRSHKHLPDMCYSGYNRSIKLEVKILLLVLNMLLFDFMEFCLFLYCEKQWTYDVLQDPAPRFAVNKFPFLSQLFCWR